MKLTTYSDIATLTNHFHLTVDASDYVAVTLDKMDMALVAECEQSDKVSDKLLALQTIAFRLEQRAEKQHSATPSELQISPESGETNEEKR